MLCLISNYININTALKSSDRNQFSSYKHGHKTVKHKKFNKKTKQNNTQKFSNSDKRFKLFMNLGRKLNSSQIGSDLFANIWFNQKITHNSSSKRQQSRTIELQGI